VRAPRTSASAPAEGADGSARALNPYGFIAQEHTHPMTQREFQKEMVRAMTSQWSRL
jgi:hypothetical protein